jgi:MFS family permease
LVFKKLKVSGLKIFTGLSFFQVLTMFRRGLFYTYLSIYIRNFLGLTVTESTLYATLPMIMSVFFQNIVWGPISDKTQKRRTLIVLGELLAGIGIIIVWGTHSLFTNLYLAGYVIIIGLTCIEAFWSMSNIGWSALVSDIYKPMERGKVLGQLQSLGGIGRILGITIGGLIYADGFGFRNGNLFFIASFVMFISTIPMFLLIPEGGIHLKEHQGTDKNLEAINDTPNVSDFERSIKYFTIFIIALAFINFGRNSISVPYSQYLTLESGFDVDSVLLSFIVNTRSVATILIGFTAGFLSKKFGHGKTLIMGTIIAIIGLIITALTGFLSFIFVGSFLIGTAEVLIYASSYAIASVLIPEEKRGKRFGIYNTTFFLSWGLASTLISGPLIDLLIFQGQTEVFAYQMAFMAGAIMCLIGLIIFIGLEAWLYKENKLHRSI